MKNLFLGLFILAGGVLIFLLGIDKQDLGFKILGSLLAIGAVAAIAIGFLKGKKR